MYIILHNYYKSTVAYIYKCTLFYILCQALFSFRISKGTNIRLGNPRPSTFNASVFILYALGAGETVWPSLYIHLVPSGTSISNLSAPLLKRQICRDGKRTLQTSRISTQYLLGKYSFPANHKKISISLSEN